LAGGRGGRQIVSCGFGLVGRGVGRRVLVGMWAAGRCRRILPARLWRRGLLGARE
jgi:hypothetical protein